MSLYRVLLRSLRRQPPPVLLVPNRTFAFSSAEEAAAERRRRKRRLRIEPPLHALRRDSPPPPRPPNSPRLPDSTSSLVGPRLNLHNRVQSLIRASDLDSAASVARRAVFSSTRPTVFTCNAIIAAMYRSRRYSDAESLFTYFFDQSKLVPNIVSYNNLINTLCDQSRVDDALAVYQRVISEAPFSPSPVTYRHLTKGLIDSSRIGEAMDLLREMLNKGHGADSLVFNNLISGFLNLGNSEKAEELFDELKERCLVYDGAVHATFMDWFFSRGMDKEAMASYKSLLDRQFKMVPATCNVLLECLIRNRRKVEAWALFDQMLDNHTPPNFQAVNSETFNMVVNECFRVGSLDEAVRAFRKVGTKANSKAFSMDVAGYNNIISRYCERGMLPEAEAMFEELCSKSLSPDVNSHRTLIDTYLAAGRVEDALKTLTRMTDSGLWLVAGYGVKVLGELVRHGNAVQCVPILRKLGEKDPKPEVSLYEVVVDGLCKEEGGGAITACRDLVEEMVRQGVHVGPDLQQRVREAFVKAGRVEEIEGVLMRNRWGNVAHPRHHQSGFSAQQQSHQSGFSAQQSPSQNGFSAQQPPPQSGYSAPQLSPQGGFSAQQQPLQRGFSAQQQSHQSGSLAQQPPPQGGYSAQLQPPQSGYSAQQQPPRSGFSPQQQPPQSSYLAQQSPPHGGFSPQQQTSQRGFSPQQQPPQSDFSPQQQPPQSCFSPQLQPPQSGFSVHQQPPQSGYVAQRQPPPNGFSVHQQPPQSTYSAQQPPHQSTYHQMAEPNQGSGFQNNPNEQPQALGQYNDYRAGQWQTGVSASHQTHSYGNDFGQNTIRAEWQRR